MFTGLVKEVGKIKSITLNSVGAMFCIDAPNLIHEIQVDDSVATNGVCLTAVKIEDNSFYAQAVHVTLEKTNLGLLKPQSPVNLELALRASDRLGGHLVQGHINGVGKIVKVLPRGGNFEVSIKPPTELLKYMILEGSIALNGISLTIADINSDIITVSIIPHTWDNTNLQTIKSGSTINIEVDMMAKYLENFVRFEKRKDTFRELLD